VLTPVLAALDPKTAWYVARAGGLVAWAMCVVSMVWGLLVSSRLVRRRGAPAWLLDLHRYLGTLTLVFVGLHLVGLWLDDYLYYGPKELFVPFTGDYRPVAVAWGTIAFWLLVAIQVSSWLMRRLPRRIWHAIHLASIPMLLLGTVHGFTAGTDRSNRLVLALAIAGSAAVIFLLGSRVAARRAARPRGAAARTNVASASRPTPTPAGQ
jgi:DMSO/TMAO reductase YedYZ heme-binding membrane subunit